MARQRAARHSKARHGTTKHGHGMAWQRKETMLLVLIGFRIWFWFDLAFGLLYQPLVTRMQPANDMGACMAFTFHLSSWMQRINNPEQLINKRCNQCDSLRRFLCVDLQLNIDVSELSAVWGHHLAGTSNAVA